MKVGLTLPSFRDDADVAIEVAATAERVGVDGVFAFDHVFREAKDGTRRPALECTTLLGAIAAEVGHFQIDPHGPMCACGERGHWEAFASGSALGRLGRERAATGRLPAAVERAGGDVDGVTGIHVGDAAQAGDPDALEVIREYAGLVAVGLAGLANILDPDRIVISGGLVELGETLFVPVREAFASDIEGFEYRPAIEIVPAQLGENAGMIGAAARARELVEQ